ncbi:MAG: hypothetical protein QM610_03740 [Chitinophagaceae bacterium]
MNRILLCLLLTGVTTVLSAQQIIEKHFSVADNQPILLKFDFPKVKVKSWDKNEVYVKVTVNINDNKNNDKFQLTDKIVDGKLIVGDTVDFKHIDPEYYVETDGVKKHFSSKQDFENYKSDHKDEKFSSYSTNNTDIQIEVYLPTNGNNSVQAKFGWVEVSDYTGPLTVKTEFGKIDAKLPASKVGTITLTNHFGKIYSDFNMKPTSSEERNFFTSITANPGNGPAYSFSSKFGNIYLRDVK